jgi:Domain of unknown function (DUF5597)/Glycosyl hydrolases family 35
MQEATMERAGRRLSFFASIILAWACVAGPLAAQSSPPIPRIVRTGSHYQLQVDGKPFLILGGQAHNSSASNPKDLEAVWQSLEAMHANTAEVPVYWQLIEPQPGQFDFHMIDAIIQGARQHNLRVILLWFGTWKWVEDSGMAYTPSWIKKDPATYFHIRDEAGQPLYNISPLSTAARDADAKAFAAMMQHIKSVDSTEHTVIMMQVENESGLKGTNRDYSPQANRAYQSAVPAELMTYLEKHRGHLMPALAAAWDGRHNPASGTWPEVFGDLAPEVFSAWTIGRYIDDVAAAGEKIYPLPMYCNAWPISPGEARAGDWPSGTPSPHVLDIWAAAAPHIFAYAPDIYSPEFMHVAREYTRTNNPFFVVETSFSPSHAAYVFPTLTEFNGLGFSPFGIDIALQDGKLDASGKALAACYKALGPLLPLIEKDRYTGKMFTVIQEDNRADAIPLSRKLAAVVSYGPERWFLQHARQPTTQARAGGVIIEMGPDDYIVAGTGFRVTFRNLQGAALSPEYISIERGTFHGLEWAPEQLLNGDERHVDLARWPGILRVRLYNAK